MAPSARSSPQSPPSYLLWTLHSHKGPVHTAVYNSGSNYFLTGGQDRQIKLWNPKSGMEVKAYSGHGYEVLGLCCTPDNTKFASCGGDRSVFVWDVATGDSFRRFQGHAGKVNAVAFNSEASILASGSFDTSVRLWDMKYKRRSSTAALEADQTPLIRSQQRMPLQILEEARDSVTSVAIRGHLIVTGSVDGFARTYDIRRGELRTDFFDQPVTSLSLTADSSMVLLTTLDSAIHALDLESGRVLKSFGGHKNTSYRSSAAFGPGEATVVMGDEDGKVWGWETETGDKLGDFQAHDRAILWTAHHPKEQQMLTASADGTVKVWGTRS